MIEFTTGNLLESFAECLINTVNCEGYMGKGIAYQFKLKFPNNNKDYIKACKSKTLVVGKLHYFKEDGKTIVNFPTKDKWRQNSKIEYIIDGLDELVRILPELCVSSIAIPPLGCGNGGLQWNEVKTIIVDKLSPIQNKYKILVYEPSRNYTTKPKEQPKLKVSNLVLMNMKLNLNRFNSLRLQKTGFIMNIFLGEHYFKFRKHKYGPYDNAIAILSKEIKAFQDFYGTKDTNEAYEIAYRTIVSDQSRLKLSNLTPALQKACEYVNRIDSDKDLECISTILFLIQDQKVKNKYEVIKKFKEWSEDKANRFTEEDIEKGISYLLKTSIITDTLIGYEINYGLQFKI